MFTGDLSNLAPMVEEGLQETYGHHRFTWFSNTIDDIVSFFKKELSNSALKPLLLTSTRTGALEALVTNVVSDSDLVWVHDESDFVDITDRFCKGAVIVSTTTLASSKELKSPRAVFFTGVKKDGTKVDIARLTRSLHKRYPRALLICDLTDSFGVDTSSVKDVPLDAVLIVPERGLMGIPGTTVVAITKRYLSRAELLHAKNTERPYLFDLVRTNTAWEKKRTTPYSPNISASVALQHGLRMIECNGGMVKHIERQKQWALTIRKVLRSKGLAVIANTQTTNGFTVCRAKSPQAARAFVNTLKKAHILVTQLEPRPQNFIIGHFGFLTKESIEYFAKALGQHVPLGMISRCDFKQTRLKRDRQEDIFSITYEEFREKAFTNLYNHGVPSDALLANITKSSETVFTYHSNEALEVALSRTIGFIGAGNIVKASVERCKKIGINNIVVYSPTLAHLKKHNPKDSRLRYWERRKVMVAANANEVYLQAHTVVLLPLLYTEQAQKLLRKKRVYMNIGTINSTKLNMIRKKGKMDVLINASARSGLINYTDLSKEIKKGWFIYYSDELPKNNNPILEAKNVFFTAHVGGSCALPQKAVSENTHKILKAAIRELVRAKPMSAKVNSYTINVINEYLKPDTILWKGTRVCWKRADKKEIRILLTDPFNTKPLRFDDLNDGNTMLIVRDISKHPQSEAHIIDEIRTFRPHIVMVRSRTKLTEKVFKRVKDIREFSTIIRPGVGVDNIYDGLLEASNQGIRIINEPTGNSFAVAEMTLHFILASPPRILLTPGPTNYYKPLFRILDYAYPHPNTNAYWQRYEELKSLISSFVGNPAETLILSGPSTGFMEAAISNLTVKEDTGLVVVHGKFGNRFAEICEKRQRSTIELRVKDSEWGRGFTPKDIEQKIQSYEKKNPEKKLTFMCFQQNETSTGVAYDQRTIKKIVATARRHNPNIMMIMDGVSGIGAYDLPVEKLGIDAAVIGSQKSIGISSGIAFVALSKRAIRTMLRLANVGTSFKAFLSNRKREEILSAFEREHKIYYASLLRLLFMDEKRRRTDIPEIFHVLSGLKSMRYIMNAGGSGAYELKHRTMALRTRAQVTRLRLPIMTKRPFQSFAVTPVLLPKGIEAAAFRKKLKLEYGFSIAGSQIDYWKKRMIRIGHLGYVYEHDISRFLRDFERCLKEMRKKR